MQEGAIYACISDLVGVGYVRRDVLVDLCTYVRTVFGW